MFKFYKIVDEDIKSVITADYKPSENWLEGECEQAYNGSWYVKGYAPVQPISEQNEAIRSKREQLYSTQIDPLHARKARKVILNDWSEADEAEYVAEVARISKEIEDENPYMVE